MMRTKSRWVLFFRHARTWAVALALGAGLLAHTNAWSADRVTLKDGTVLECTIVREAGGIVWVRVTGKDGTTTERMLTKSEYTKIERDAAAQAQAPAPQQPAGESASAPKSAAPAAGDAPAAPVASEPARSGPTGPKGAVITLGDEENGNMVGQYMTAEILRRGVKPLKEELAGDGEKIVVLRFHSGGGLGLEVQKISDVIETEYKTNFRTVAWISTAISAAAMSAHSIEEIYFTTKGNYGACTGYYTLSQAVEGFDLEMSLHQMEKISTRGKYNPLIMRAMQVQQPLSATVDENGEVHWFPDTTSGQIVVNRDKEILTFNESSAKAVKFSKGTADTLDELGRLMGFHEIHWVGKKIDGVPWPVCKAEEMQRDFREQTKKDEDRASALYRQYAQAVNAANGAPRAQRAAFVGKARQALDRLKGVVRNNPNAIFFPPFQTSKEGYDEWIQEQEKLLRDLMK